MMAEIFICGWFSWDYFCLLGRSGASVGGSPNLIGVKLGLGKLQKDDSLVEAQNFTFF